MRRPHPCEENAFARLDLGVSWDALMGELM